MREFLCFAVVAALHAPAFAASKQETILYSGEVSRLPVGARTAAMGDAAVSLPLDAPSAYWNPAAPSLMRKYQIWLEGASLYGGLSNQAVVAANVPLLQQIGVAVVYAPFYSGDIPLFDSLPEGTRSDGTSSASFHNVQNALSLSVAKGFSFPLPRFGGLGGYPLPVDIGVGLGFKAVWQTIAPTSNVRMGMNINCDLGLLARFGLDYDIVKKRVNREFTLGVSAKDVLPSKMIWINSQYFGLSYIDKSGLLRSNWTVAISMHRTFEEGLNSRSRNENDRRRVGYLATYHAGIEADILEMVGIRVGISDRMPELGAGVHYKNFSLDYAFKFDSIEFSPVRLSLAVTFYGQVEALPPSRRRQRLHRAAQTRLVHC